MSLGWLSLVFLIALMALIPWGVRWVQRRLTGGVLGGNVLVSKVVSAVAVGPHQQVVTVEVGPPGARVRLVLGVTAQSITCLHQSDVLPGVPDGLSLSGQISANPSPM